MFLINKLTPRGLKYFLNYPLVFESGIGPDTNTGTVLASMHPYWVWLRTSINTLVLWWSTNSWKWMNKWIKFIKLMRRLFIGAADSVFCFKRWAAIEDSNERSRTWKIDRISLVKPAVAPPFVDVMYNVLYIPSVSNPQVRPGSPETGRSRGWTTTLSPLKSFSPWRNRELCLRAASLKVGVLQ